MQTHYFLTFASLFPTSPYLPACMIVMSFFTCMSVMSSLGPSPFSQHASLRRVNGNAARRHLDFTSREGEVDQYTVSVCDER